MSPAPRPAPGALPSGHWAPHPLAAGVLLTPCELLSPQPGARGDEEPQRTWEDLRRDLRMVLLSPLQPGFNSVATARIFYKLMLRLGFQQFYVQGGDWGALICTNMAQLVPR